jgi:hypothetical protein
VLTVEGLMHGLYLLWWVHEKHVPAATVAAIIAFGELAIAALEIPTGWVADRFGHRVSLIVGALVQASGMLMAWLGEGAGGVLASVLLIAIGDTFRSGADKALVYRSCAAIGQGERFQPIEARAHSIQISALVALTLLGGLVVRTFGFAAGWLAETAMSFGGLAVALAMREPPPAPITDEDDCGGDPPTARSSLPLRRLLSVILPVSFVAAITSAAAFLVQTASDVGVDRITLIVASFTLAEAVGSAAAVRLPSRARVPALLSGAAGLVAVGALVEPRALPLAVTTMSLLVGAAEPVRTAVLQRLTVDSARARTASVTSAIDKIFTMAGTVAAGYARR